MGGRRTRGRPQGGRRLADSHLYLAKQAGRDRVSGGEVDLPPGLGHRSAWAARIDRALTQHDLRMVYQPICRLSDGTVIGNEALARPHDMAAGDSVEDLFAEAQRIGRIRDLDWLCRRIAIADAPWRLQPGRALFLNVSALTLLDPVHGADQLMLVLKAAGARPDLLVLEITEREIITDLARVRQVLASYRLHGVRFALDDVGEGHSTLELLAAANPEFIKIARSLTMTAAPPGAGGHPGRRLLRGDEWGVGDRRGSRTSWRPGRPGTGSGARPGMVAGPSVEAEELQVKGVRFLGRRRAPGSADPAGSPAPRRRTASATPRSLRTGQGTGSRRGHRSGREGAPQTSR